MVDLYKGTLGETSQNESRLQFSWRQFQQQRYCKSPIESVPSLYPGYGRLPIYAFSDTFEHSFRIYGPRKYGALKKKQTWKYVVTIEITVGKSLLR